MNTKNKKLDNKQSKQNSQEKLISSRSKEFLDLNQIKMQKSISFEPDEKHLTVSLLKGSPRRNSHISENDFNQLSQRQISISVNQPEPDTKQIGKDIQKLKKNNAKEDLLTLHPQITHVNNTLSAKFGFKKLTKQLHNSVYARLSAKQSVFTHRESKFERSYSESNAKIQEAKLQMINDEIAKNKLIELKKASKNLKSEKLHFEDMDLDENPYTNERKQKLKLGNNVVEKSVKFQVNRKTEFSINFDPTIHYSKTFSEFQKKEAKVWDQLNEKYGQMNQKLEKEDNLLIQYLNSIETFKSYSKICGQKLRDRYPEEIIDQVTSNPQGQNQNNFAQISKDKFDLYNQNEHKITRRHSHVLGGCFARMKPLHMINICQRQPFLNIDMTIQLNNQLGYGPNGPSVKIPRSNSSESNKDYTDKPIIKQSIKSIRRMHVDQQMSHLGTQLKSKVDTPVDTKAQPVASPSKTMGLFAPKQEGSECKMSKVIVAKLRNVKKNIQNILKIVRMRHFQDHPNLTSQRTSSDVKKQEKQNEQQKWISKFFKEKDYRNQIYQDILKYKLMNKWINKTKESIQQEFRNRIFDLEARAINKDNNHLRKQYFENIKNINKTFNWESLRQIQNKDLNAISKERKELENKLRILSENNLDESREQSATTNIIAKLNKRYNILSKGIAKNNQEFSNIQFRYVRQFQNDLLIEKPELKLSTEQRQENFLWFYRRFNSIDSSVNMLVNVMSLTIFRNHPSAVENFENMINRRVVLFHNISENIRALFENKIERLEIVLNDNSLIGLDYEEVPKLEEKQAWEEEDDHQASQLVMTQLNGGISKIQKFRRNAGRPSLSINNLFGLKKAKSDESILSTRLRSKSMDSMILDNSKITNSSSINITKQSNQQHQNSINMSKIDENLNQSNTINKTNDQSIIDQTNAENSNMSLQLKNQKSMMSSIDTQSLWNRNNTKIKNFNLENAIDKLSQKINESKIEEEEIDRRIHQREQAKREREITSQLSQYSNKSNKSNKSLKQRPPSSKKENELKNKIPSVSSLHSNKFRRKQVSNNAELKKAFIDMDSSNISSIKERRGAKNNNTNTSLMLVEDSQMTDESFGFSKFSKKISDDSTRNGDTIDNPQSTKY